MKYVTDSYTGKRFYYNTLATWTIEGTKYNTVSRVNSNGKMRTLHPTKLSAKDFQRLNNKEQGKCQ
ncbi:hypothetical protein ES703_121300 [subsurface metagenome]